MGADLLRGCDVPADGRGSLLDFVRSVVKSKAEDVCDTLLGVAGVELAKIPFCEAAIRDKPCCDWLCRNLEADNQVVGDVWVLCSMVGDDRPSDVELNK